MLNPQMYVSAHLAQNNQNILNHIHIVSIQCVQSRGASPTMLSVLLYNRTPSLSHTEYGYPLASEVGVFPAILVPATSYQCAYIPLPACKLLAILQLVRVQTRVLLRPCRESGTHSIASCNLNSQLHLSCRLIQSKVTFAPHCLLCHGHTWLVASYRFVNSCFSLPVAQQGNSNQTIKLPKRCIFSEIVCSAQ